MNQERFYILVGIGVILSFFVIIYALWTFSWGLFPRMVAAWMMFLFVVFVAHIYRK